jgi:hypothetical protein
VEGSRVDLHVDCSIRFSFSSEVWNVFPRRKGPDISRTDA